MPENYNAKANVGMEAARPICESGNIFSLPDSVVGPGVGCWER